MRCRPPRKVITVDQFRALFLPTEIHAILRKCSLTSQIAGAIANVWSAFVTKRTVHSDHPDLAAALALFVSAEILTQSRADRIAAFLPPAE